MTRTIRPWLASAIFAMIAMATSMPTQAQSSYALTTIKGAMSTDEVLFIDTQNRVMGTLTLMAGFKSDPALGGFPSPYYKNYLGQWAVPVFGTSVSATKISTTSAYLSRTSPDGNKLLTSAGLYDRSSKKFQTYPLLFGLDVNNAGVVVGFSMVTPRPGEPTDANHSDAYNRAQVWTPGQAQPVTLPAGEHFVGAKAFGINAKGTIVGAVYGAHSRLNTRAARWVNGAVEVLENQPGRGSSAIDVSEAGHVLVHSWETIVVPVPVSSTETYDRVDYINDVYGVIENGSYTPIVSNVAGYHVVNARSINASSTVIGTLARDLSAGTPPGAIGTASRRAYLWKNGLMVDLTTLVASKSIKLPAGAVLNNIVTLNDQGSLVAVYDGPTSTSQPVYVRLQAKP